MEGQGWAAPTDLPGDYEAEPERARTRIFQAPGQWTTPPGQDQGAPGRGESGFGWQPQTGNGRPSGSRRRGRGGEMARVVVLAVVIGVVAGFAVALLTARSTRPAAPASPGTVSGSPAALQSSGAQQAAAGMFPGYPGQHGSEVVNSVASGSGAQLAAGTADGRAAIWRQAAGSGTWTLLTSAVIAGQPPGSVMTSIVHGPAGWLAVGDVNPVAFGGAGTAQAPVVLTSPDGTSWHSVTGSDAAFWGNGFQVNAAASDSAGYVVVGSQTMGGAHVDAMWWSQDLSGWTRGSDTIGSSVSSASIGMADSMIFAAAAAPGGVVAVGTHNGCHTAWVTTDGQHWTSYDIPKPAGSQDPLLDHVAVAGSVVVAAGDLGVGAGRVPLIVVSRDGGVHWQETAIGDSASLGGPQGTVTALAADGSGFIAAGLVGPKGAQHAVTWTSPDGVTWSQATPAGEGARAVTVLSSDGSSVTQVNSVAGAGGATGAVEVTSR